MGKGMVRAQLNTLMEKNGKANGKMMNIMVRVYTLILMV